MREKSSVMIGLDDEGDYVQVTDHVGFLQIEVSNDEGATTVNLMAPEVHALYTFLRDTWATLPDGSEAP